MTQIFQSAPAWAILAEAAAAAPSAGENVGWLTLLISGFCLVAGSLFAIIGGIGICRLPEFFSRMHGAGITDTMGAGLILIGLMVHAGPSLVAFKLIVILFFLLVTSPSSCHALAHSAIVRGLQFELDPPRQSDPPELPARPADSSSREGA